MNVKVAMIEVGMAMPAISVLRQSRMKSSTVKRDQHRAEPQVDAHRRRSTP